MEGYPPKFHFLWQKPILLFGVSFPMCQIRVICKRNVNSPLIIMIQTDLILSQYCYIYYKIYIYNFLLLLNGLQPVAENLVVQGRCHFGKVSKEKNKEKHLDTISKYCDLAMPKDSMLYTSEYGQIIPFFEVLEFRCRVSHTLDSTLPLSCTPNLWI